MFKLSIPHFIKIYTFDNDFFGINIDQQYLPPKLSWFLRHSIPPSLIVIILQSCSISVNLSNIKYNIDNKLVGSLSGNSIS